MATITPPSRKHAAGFPTPCAGDVTIPELQNFGLNPTQTLQPIAGLTADLISIGLDPGLASQLLPTDFEAQFFTRFDLVFRPGGA